MPIVLDSYAWNASSGSHETYPYDKWFNGRIWMLQQGTDFTCTANSLRSTIRNAAVKRHMRLRTSVPDSKTVVVQAYGAATT
jgi:hypothetical protein